ncbi:class I SAM-dependent methyltransferase [Helicobacter turcicus]|uniref:class I SAM-dependent methyltransferase n=1 Tax=Helicobacter turcicus TaxID=2867412 RepID=UPI003211AD15
MHTPKAFLEDVVKLLEYGGILYIEVPNIDEFIQHNRFYEIFNDHCGYYQENVLINTLEKLGCTFIKKILTHSDQHMGLFFKKKHLKFKLYDFNDTFSHQIQQINSVLENYNSVAIYGAGAHGNTMLNFLNQNSLEKIKNCFDLDTIKHNKFLQNSDIKIFPPQKEYLDNIEAILIVTPLYEEEVIEYLIQNGFKGDIITTKREIKIKKV